MRGKEIDKAIRTGLVGFKPLDLSPETKAAADAELSRLLKALGVEELKRVDPKDFGVGH